MDRRAMHFVGSIPGKDAEEVMRDSLHRAGPYLRSLPDGETGERNRWIVHIIESFRANPGFELVSDGDWSSYESAPTFRVRRGHRLTAADLDLGHVAQFTESYPIFQRIRAELDRSDVSFQVGIPSDLDLAMFTFGPSGMVRYRRPFAEALGAGIASIHQMAGTDVVFQLEAPVELVSVARTPAPARPATAALMSTVVGLARRAPAGARFGVHLCLGDLNNTALGRLRDAGPAVLLANAIARRWPAGRELEYVHVPLAAGDQPAPLDRAFYQPLSQLRLPPSTRLIAGFVHENRDLDDLRRTLAMIEDCYRGRVDVAASCGLGRRTPAQASAVTDRALQLCAGQPGG